MKFVLNTFYGNKFIVDLLSVFTENINVISFRLNKLGLPRRKIHEFRYKSININFLPNVLIQT